MRWQIEPSSRPIGMNTEASPASRPRCLDGTNSCTYGMEVMLSPPTPMPTPTRQIAYRYHAPFGMNRVSTVNTRKKITQQRKEPRRPMRSDMRPHRIEPTTVPSPVQEVMMPAWTPVRFQAPVSRAITKPTMKMSKNSAMLPTTASATRLF